MSLGAFLPGVSFELFRLHRTAEFVGSNPIISTRLRQTSPGLRLATPRDFMAESARRSSGEGGLISMKSVDIIRSISHIGEWYVGISMKTKPGNLSVTSKVAQAT